MHKVINTQCTCVLFLFVFANQNLSPIDFASSRRAASTPFPSRDQKPVTATLLESAFTNRDARKPFRMRICENCRVSYPFFAILVSRRTFPCKKLICKSLVFYALRTLPSSVSCKSFVCHSYENDRVSTNKSRSRTRPYLPEPGGVGTTSSTE